jgi:hypothetical protein
MLPSRPPESSALLATPHAGIANGSLYLSRVLCDRYLPGVSAIALQKRDEGVFILPLQGSTSGGLLLKIRNAHGDRVAHAAEFLALLGIEPDTPQRYYAVRWVSEFAGLRIEGLDNAQT